MASPLSTLNPPTLREIARRAGVSHTTVSLSLRNHPSIPEPTRERLRRLADELGYRSNVLVSALMSQVRLKQHKSGPEVVGFLTGGQTANDWRNHSASVGFYEGARQRAQKLGLRIEPFWVGLGGVASAATCRALHARGIHGNLISPFPVPVYNYELDWAHLICVGLGYVFNQHALHRATHNHFRGAFLAFEKLVQLGYQRIGLMLDREENSRVNYTWLGGYLAAQNRAAGPRLEPLLTSVFIAVDPCTKVNGCLQVIENSHHCGRINHILTGDQAGADKERVEELLKRPERFPLVYVEMEPGDTLFFHPNLLHRSAMGLGPRRTKSKCRTLRI